MSKLRLTFLLSLALAALVAGCGSDDDSSTDEDPAPRPPSRSTTAPPTRSRRSSRGELTVATDSPAFPPYFAGRRPDQRRGLRERRRLRDRRHARLRRGRRRTGSSSPSTPPTPRVRRSSTSTSTRSRSRPSAPRQVDFTTPYYTAKQAVVALKDSDAAVARRRSPTWPTRTSASRSAPPAWRPSSPRSSPSTDPQVFDTSNDVVSALKNEQVDAVVVDVPTAFYLTAVQVPEATTVGQFEAPGGDEWGALLAEGLAADRLRLRRDRRALRLRRARPRSSRRGSRRRPTRPSSSSPGASGAAGMSDRRAEREAAKRRRDRRGPDDRGRLDGRRPRRASPPLILTSPGWPVVRDSFFNAEVFTDSFPDILNAFWLDVRVFCVVEVVGPDPRPRRGARADAEGPGAVPGPAARGRSTPTSSGASRRSSSSTWSGSACPRWRSRPRAATTPLGWLPTEPVVLGGIALALSYGAYVAEVYRAGLNSVHRGQRDAALAVGLTEGQALRHVDRPAGGAAGRAPAAQRLHRAAEGRRAARILGVRARRSASRRSTPPRTSTTRRWSRPPCSTCASRSRWRGSSTATAGSAGRPR